MTQSRRIAKVSSLLKKEITLILLNDIDDDLIIENFLSITKLELTRDLQYCKVYINSAAGEQINNSIVENLNTSKSFIKHNLAKRIQMRRIPDLIFKHDKVFSQGLSVLKILDKLRKKNNHQE